MRIERHPDLSRETCEAAAVVLAQRIKVHIGSTVAVQLEEPGHPAAQRGQVQAGLRPALTPVSGGAQGADTLARGSGRVPYVAAHESRPDGRIARPEPVRP